MSKAFSGANRDSFLSYYPIKPSFFSKFLSPLYRSTGCSSELMPKTHDKVSSLQRRGPWGGCLWLPLCCAMYLRNTSPPAFRLNLFHPYRTHLIFRCKCQQIFSGTRQDVCWGFREVEGHEYTSRPRLCGDMCLHFQRTAP